MDSAADVARVLRIMPDTHAAETLPGTAPTELRSTSADASAATRRFVPGEAWYALPPLLLIVGLWLGLQITHGTMEVPEGIRLEVPGNAAFTITEPGQYVLWDEYRTEWKGARIDVPPILKAIDASALVPGQIPEEITPKAQSGQVQTTMAPGEMIYDRAFVTVNQMPADQPVRQSAVLHSRENTDGTVRVTLGRYKLAAGDYRVAVWGEFPGRVFQLRRDYGVRYYAGFIGGLGLSLAGGLGAPALFLWIYLRRRAVAGGRRPLASTETETPPSAAL